MWSEGDIFYYQDLTTHTTGKVWIARECSGILSVIVFLSAFISFVFTETSRISLNIFSFLIIGLITSYLANLFRMALIILSGHYWGADALAWSHANLGWIIFMGWMAIFWYFLTNYMDFFHENGVRDTNI